MYGGKGGDRERERARKESDRDNDRVIDRLRIQQHLPFSMPAQLCRARGLRRGYRSPGRWPRWHPPELAKGFMPWDAGTVGCPSESLLPTRKQTHHNPPKP